MNPKTYFLRTYGCQMNELDSEVIAGILNKRGLKRVDNEDDGDILIFNTCWIRELAARKALGKIGQLCRSKKDRIVGLTGCMANAKKEKLFTTLPKLDFVLGTNNIHQLNTVLDDIAAGQNKIVKADPLFHEELDYTQAARNDDVKAYVSIIRGCDKFCTYCCVPYTRGREVSRTKESILEECQKLVDSGAKEITLLGQNVNSYGKDQPNWSYKFHDLLYDLDKIPDMGRIRFMTSHPIDITRELMVAIGELPSVCEFVHFPVQAGSSRVLKKMHRIYTKEQYMEKVAMLRELVPGVALGTDIIVGFPTETDAEFEETVEVMREIEYSVAFLFEYSPRSGTPSKRWKDDVPPEVKAERLQRLLRLHNQIAVKQRQEMVGSEVEVLFEKESKDGNMKGRTRCWKQVVAPGDTSLIGTFQKVKVTGFSHQTLLGSVMKPKSHPLELLAV